MNILNNRLISSAIHNGRISSEFWCLRLVTSVTVRRDDGNDLALVTATVTMTINGLDDDVTMIISMVMPMTVSMS